MPLLESRFVRTQIIALLFLALTGRASAADEGPSATDRMRDGVLRMTEFLDTMLPGVLEENNITLHFRPKFGDLRDEEYMRFPFELRYGYTKRLELRAGLVPYTPNPFNSGRDHRWGLGEMRFGGRFDLGKGIRFFDDTTVGIETRTPLGKPPVEVNDHYTHVTPFIVAARKLRRWPSTTFYANMGYDHSFRHAGRGPPPPEVVRRHIFEAAPGLLFKPSEWGYFGEYRFRHIREIDDQRLAHEIQFGTIWDVPIEKSARLRLPGKWQLELAYRVEHEEGRGTHHGISTRVNWRTTIREVLNATNSKSTKLPPQK